MYVFSKNHIFISLIFSMVFCLYFIFSLLIYIISLFLLTLGFLCSSYSSFWYKFRLLFVGFSCFLRQACIAKNCFFPLRLLLLKKKKKRLLLLHSIIFRKLCSHSHLSQIFFILLCDFFTDSLIVY